MRPEEVTKLRPESRIKMIPGQALAEESSAWGRQAYPLPSPDRSFLRGRVPDSFTALVTM